MSNSPPMRFHVAALLVSGTLAILAQNAHAGPIPPYVPVQWTKFVKVKGQPEPIPEQWLDSEEARIAHDLVLPEVVPKPVPFDFDKAWWRSLVPEMPTFGKAWWRKWSPGKTGVALQYYAHLCRTEAGEWIFKKVQDVEGFYFARPEGMPTGEALSDPYALEMPWIQRIFFLSSIDRRPQDLGWWFVEPPFYNYKYIELPRGAYKWQAGIEEKYVKIFGFTMKPLWFQGKLTEQLYQDTPMQAIGIPKTVSQFGYTWRGIRRPRDREMSISGGEIIIYDVQTREILAIRRTFVYGPKNRRGKGEILWELAAQCSQLKVAGTGMDFQQFAFDVLQTNPPSSFSGK